MGFWNGHEEVNKTVGEVKDLLRKNTELVGRIISSSLAL